MMKKITYFGLSLWFFFIVLGTIHCGGNSALSLNAGSGNFSPSPEDVFDLPNNLPDSFITVSCPDTGGTRVFDLQVKVEDFDDANARKYQADFDGDGTLDDALLLVEDDLAPGNFVIEAFSLEGDTFDVTEIDFSLVLTGILMGHEFDENMQSQEDVNGDLPQSLGTAILVASWIGNNPLFNQIFFAVNFPPDVNFPNAPAVPPGGDWEANLAGGVHVVAAKITDTLDTRHCTQLVFRLLLCPVAGHCDANGAPL